MEESESVPIDSPVGQTEASELIEFSSTRCYIPEDGKIRETTKSFLQIKERLWKKVIWTLYRTAIKEQDFSSWMFHEQILR